jgi:hypothetical protein
MGFRLALASQDIELVFEIRIIETPQCGIPSPSHHDPCAQVSGRRQRDDEVIAEVS